MYKTEEIRIRDPYVVVKDGAYYMYRSVDESVIVVHKSRDLALWEEAVTVCTLTEAFDENGRIRLERDK